MDAKQPQGAPTYRLPRPVPPLAGSRTFRLWRRIAPCRGTIALVFVALIIVLTFPSVIVVWTAIPPGILLVALVSAPVVCPVIVPLMGEQNCRSRPEQQQTKPNRAKDELVHLLPPSSLEPMVMVVTAEMVSRILPPVPPESIRMAVSVVVAVVRGPSIVMVHMAAVGVIVVHVPAVGVIMVYVPAIAVVVIDVATIGVVVIYMPAPIIGVMGKNRGSYDEGCRENYPQYAYQTSRLHKCSPFPFLNTGVQGKLLLSP